MDEEIVRLLRARDEAGVALLQKAHGNLLRYVIRGVLPDERDAEECYADVCLRAWAYIGGYDPARGSLRAWLTAAARNAAYSRARAAARLSEPLDENAPGAPSAEEALLRQERGEALRAALARLPERDRRLFLRKYYYLQPTAQIAAELGMTERAVEGRLYRLRARLRDELGGEWT